MARTPLVKALEEAGVKDGLVLNFAGQEPRNDKVVLDAIDAAVKRRAEQIDRLGED